MAALCGGSLLTSFAVRAQDASLDGKPVAEVRIVDEAGNVVAETPPFLFQPGKPFDIAVERNNLRQLYATGDYSDIRVDAKIDAKVFDPKQFNMTHWEK